ncbi:NAD-binding protein [Dentipellis sp. KUC8613]|nr:NAD-binding protein [Dentipellis sp. KUC8613]
MSDFKTIAVAGVGNIGTDIVEELIKKQNEGKVEKIVLLTRSSSNSAAEKFAQQGVQTAVVNYGDKASLLAALTGVDVVVSALGHDAVQDGSQAALARAAKEAGVRLFLPSEYGGVTGGHQTGPFAGKAKAHALLKELDLPYALIHTGLLMKFAFSPIAGIDLPNGKATIGGDGTPALSFTTIHDAARFVAHILTTLPFEKLAWRVFCVEGDRVSFNEVFEQYTAKTGRPITVTRRPISELQAVVNVNPADRTSAIQLLVARGSTVGRKEDLANGDFPEWNPKKVIDVVTA